MTKDEKLTAFTENLRQDENVLAVIVFGSYARGNDRPESDIDLVVILRNGYRRVAEYLEGQAFEIIYTTENKATDYWDVNKHDAVGLWSIAKILFDRDGTGERLRKYGEELCKRKPDALDNATVEHLRFDAEDALRSAEVIYKSDPATALLLLHKKSLDLINVYFDMQQRWHPAPKQQLELIQHADAELGGFFRDFYMAPAFEEKLEFLNKIVARILK